MGSPLSWLVLRMVFPSTLVASVALLLAGTDSGGGGFAAGVVAALGVLLRHVVAGVGRTERSPRWPRLAPALVVLGVAVMALVAFAPLAVEEPPLSHRPAPGEPLVRLGPVELHTALAFETGLGLATLGFLVSVGRCLAPEELETPR